MPSKPNSDTELPELKFVSLRYHLEPDKILIVEIGFPDGTVQRHQTTDGNEIKLLAKLLGEVSAHISMWNRIEKEAGRKF